MEGSIGLGASKGTISLCVCVCVYASEYLPGYDEINQLMTSSTDGAKIKNNSKEERNQKP